MTLRTRLRRSTAWRVLWSYTGLIEAQSWAMLLTFGVFFTLPLETFKSGSAYVPMSLLMTETEWGCVFLASSAVPLLGILTGSPLLRLGGLVLTAATYGFLGGLYWRGNPSGTGWIGFAVLFGSVVAGMAMLGDQVRDRKASRGAGGDG